MGFGMLGQWPQYPVPPIPAIDLGAMALAALMPLGAGLLIGEAIARQPKAWELRHEPNAIERFGNAAVLIGFATICAAVLVSVVFGAASHTQGWFRPAELVSLLDWPDRTIVWSVRAAFAAPLIIGLALALPILIRPRKLHGAARFATWFDAKRAKLDSRLGVVLGKFGGRRLVYGGQGHVLGVAPSRSGKGVGWIIPTLFEWPGSVLNADPKRENYEATSGWRRKTLKQPVFAFDPFSPTTARWNPLAYIQEVNQHPEDEIDRVARIMYPDSGRDTHWVDGARGAFRGTLAHLWAADRANLNLGHVARWAAMNLYHEETLTELATNETQPLAKAEFSKLVATPAKERGSFLSSMNTVLSPWLLPSVDYATSASDFDFRTLRQNPQTIHFVLSPDNAGRSVALQRIFWQQIIDALTRHLPTANEPWPVLILLDEFTLPGPLPLIMESAGFLAGYGVKLFLVVQSRHQLEATYDAPRTKALLDTIAVRAYYAPNDQTSAEQLSAELGTANFRAKSRNRSQGKTSVSLSDQRRPLLLPQEILQLGADTVLVLTENGPPLKGRKERYYSSPRYKSRARVRQEALGGTPNLRTETRGPPMTTKTPRTARAQAVADALYQLTRRIVRPDADRAEAEQFLRRIYGEPGA